MNKNDFAPNPPMGWNSYDYYNTEVNEAQVRANAEYMASHLKEFGWEYVVVDIQWYAVDAGSQSDKYQYIPFGKVVMDEYSRREGVQCFGRVYTLAGAEVRNTHYARNSARGGT